MRILVVDDDQDILQLVSIHLKREGYKVEQASSAASALKLLEDRDVDLAIVDVMMPQMNGFELTKILTRDLDIPVILLTAKGQLADKERGFLAGSEDYIVKPFEPKELLFRVAVVLRRSGRSLESQLSVGNVKLDRQNFEVTIDQHTLVFPLKEFELLSILMARVGKVTQRSILFEQTWGADYMGNELTLNTHINRVRERLKKYEANIEIQTIRGIGYKLEVSE
ncbi:MAG: response regulator transcription factor [Lysinibacillus sp.]